MPSGSRMAVMRAAISRSVRSVSARRAVSSRGVELAHQLGVAQRDGGLVERRRLALIGIVEGIGRGGGNGQDAERHALGQQRRGDDGRNPVSRTTASPAGGWMKLSSAR